MAFRFLVLAITIALTSSLQLPVSSATAARAPAVRPAFAARSAVLMCDAPAEEAPAAEAPVEAAATEEKKGGGRKKGGGIPLEDLVVGAEVEGKIRSVMTYGAFIDVGAATDALLHVSEISNEFVEDATEKLTAGDSIKCKIKAINLEKQQLALTCKEPRAGGGGRGRGPKVDLTKYESASDKDFITGKVNSITDFGAFVTIEEGVDGLVHISQIQEGGVGKVSDVLEVGQEIQVRVQSVEKSKRRIGLSMLPWKEQTEEEKRGGRRGGRGGFGGDVGFGEADLAFRLTPEEVEALAVGDAPASPFEAAFQRAAMVETTKAGKKSYSRQVL